MNTSKYAAAILFAAAFSAASAEPREASAQDKCILTGLMAQTAMGERLAGTDIGQAMEKMTERYMVVAQNDATRAFVERQIARVTRGIYRLPQSALNAVPKSDYEIFARDAGKAEYQLCMETLTGKPAKAE